MSNEVAITTIETIKKKLKKYSTLQEHEKVKEYLRKLQHTTVTSSLIQETKIDTLLRQLASNKAANYSSTAKHLLKKWHHKRLLSKSISSKAARNTSDSIIEKQSEDDVINSPEISESQIFDDSRKRKVLSLAQYLESKKHVLSPSGPMHSTQNKLTATQIEVINAQFKATTEKLTASASDLANIVDKTLIQPDKISTNRADFIVKKIVVEQSKAGSTHDLWAEDDEDDDDYDTKDQSRNTQSQTVNSSSNAHMQKVR